MKAPEQNLPDSMELVLQLGLLTPRLNESLHLLGFITPTCLEALGIMEYEATSRESDLIFNVVVASLFNKSHPAIQTIVAHSPAPRG